LVALNQPDSAARISVALTLLQFQSGLFTNTGDESSIQKLKNIGYLFRAEKSKLVTATAVAVD
jgi:hypothetical protein